MLWSMAKATTKNVRNIAVDLLRWGEDKPLVIILRDIIAACHNNLRFSFFGRLPRKLLGIQIFAE